MTSLFRMTFERSYNENQRHHYRFSQVSLVVLNTVAMLMNQVDSTLPDIEHFHSLVPLDTTNQKSVAVFGYPSWIYKATSTKDGKIYCLRRLEGMYGVKYYVISW